MWGVRRHRNQEFEQVAYNATSSTVSTHIKH